MHCISSVQTKVEKGLPGIALTCSKWATPSFWGTKGQGGAENGKAKQEVLPDVVLLGRNMLWKNLFFCFPAWNGEERLFLCVQESVIIALVLKKMCFFQGIQIALISRKIHTAGLGLFKRHHDESVSHAGPIFSFILISFSLNLVVFVKKKKEKGGSGGKGRTGSRFEFQVITYQMSLWVSSVEVTI